MRSAPVESFGRPTEEPAAPSVVLLPPVVLPGVQLPVTLVVDVTSLAEAAVVIQRMVADAIRAGFAEALNNVEAVPGAGQVADLTG